jgi:integrase
VFLRVVGDVQLNKLTSGYIRQQILKANIPPVTANEYLDKWKACLRWGYENDFIEDFGVIQKLKKFKEETSRKERIEDKYLETDEMKKLLESMNDKPRNKLFTEFLLLTGMRIGEVIALDLDDISDGYIHVSKNYDVNNDIITTPKTKDSIRDIFIQQELADLLKEIEDFMQNQQVNYGYEPTKYLFTSHLGKRMSYDYYRQYLKAKSIEVLGRPITAHALRHTHTSMLAAQGVPIETISRRLGHSNSKITREVYMHVMEELKQKENDMIKNINLLG